MKKILFVATITDHFYYFHLPYLKFFHDLGWEVSVAGKGERKLLNCDVQYDIPFARSPFSKGNIEAFKQLKEVINNNDYDIIHCHTPVGGIVTRLIAQKKRKSGAKVLYTAHGFHFYKGAPKINWLIYYPIEWIFSEFTDCLITINQEDYDFAKGHFKKPQVKLVDGVGYNSDLFYPITKEEKLLLRKEKGYNDEDKILIYVAELNANKNQQMLLRMLKEVDNEKVKLLLVGADNYSGQYQKLAEELKIQDKVEFLGHREDVAELLKLSDVCVASSKREGLPVNIMEAMAIGLPVVANENRGHNSLIKDESDGFIIKSDDYKAMSVAVNRLLENKILYNDISSKAEVDIKRFSKENVTVQMSNIYQEFMR